MNLSRLIALARARLGGAMESSARLCLADAIALRDAVDYAGARAAALRSLRYSVGILDVDYRRASAGSTCSACRGHGNHHGPWAPCSRCNGTGVATRSTKAGAS